MSSPQGNWNNPYHKSPYSKPIYPSMIASPEGFIPLSFSSPNQKDQGNKQRPSNNYRQSGNNYQRNRGYKQRDYSNRGGGGDYNSQSHSNTRKYHSGPSNSDDISNYIHPSMFEDPWKELIQQNEIKKKFDHDRTEDTSTRRDVHQSSGSDEDDEKIK